MKLIDAQVDRIVGPTHHYGGLGVGNRASIQNKGNESNPRAAALQGLEKMRLVAEMGVPQLILPPHPRPDATFLNSLGYATDSAEDWRIIADESPSILSASMSCSAMWTANAATVAASIDGPLDQPVMTIANLSSSLHRAIEPTQTLDDLQKTFPDHVSVLSPLQGGAPMRDEGAANHMRLGSDQALPGIHIFVYGDQQPMPERYWPRQTLAACQAIARLHRLPSENVFYLKQHPAAIDAGAFHNDVVAASHHGVLLHHEKAFYESDEDLQHISERFRAIYDRELIRVCVEESQLSLADAVKTYLFNSQIVSGSGDSLPTLIAPVQVSENADASAIVQSWCRDKMYFERSHFLDLRQSMSGGGGPACLRLRVPLTEQELDQGDFPNRWTPELHRVLSELIQEHYPESVGVNDLIDAAAIKRAVAAEQAIRKELQHGT